MLDSGFYEVPVEIALGVIILVLAIAIGLSVMIPCQKERHSQKRSEPNLK